MAIAKTYAQYTEHVKYIGHVKHIENVNYIEHPKYPLWILQCYISFIIGRAQLEKVFFSVLSKIYLQ